MKKETYEEQMAKLLKLVKILNQNIEEVGKRIVSLMKLDRDRTVKELREKGVPLDTVVRLERVGLGKTEPRVFANGTVAGELAERLNIKDQKKLLDVGCPTVVGGTTEKPHIETLKLGQLTDYNANILIDKKRGVLRSVDEQLKARALKLVSRKKQDFEVYGNEIVIIRKRWNIVELITLLKNLPGTGGNQALVSS